MFYLNVESPKHRNDNTLYNYRLFQTWVKSGLIYDSTVDKQHNYLYDLSKQGSNHCNNGWQAVEAAAPDNSRNSSGQQQGGTKHAGPGCCCDWPGGPSGVLLSRHMERVNYFRRFVAFQACDVMMDNNWVWTWSWWLRRSIGMIATLLIWTENEFSHT